MATEKYFVFSESGELKRMKGRIVRFLDNEDPTGSDKDAIRTSLEVSPDAAGLVQADVGTAPNEIPVNGMLGDMAYQSSDGVSMGVVEADSLDVGGQSKAGSLVVYDANGNASNSLDVTYSGSSGVANIQADSSGGSTALTFGTSNAGVVATRMTIDSSGRVGIGTASPGSYYTGTDDLVVAGASGDRGITIATANTANGGLMFADSDSTTIGRIQYSHGTNEMKFRVNNTEVWSINSSGNLVANGTAIDFGSGASTTLDDYEEGTWTPTLATVNAGPTAGAGAAYSGTYTKIGRLVQCSINLDFDDTGTAVAVDDRFTFGSLPFSVIPAQDTYTGAGSLYIYASTGSGNNAFGTVGVTQSGDSIVCYITHLDGALNYGRNVRAVFSYESDA